MKQEATGNKQQATSNEQEAGSSSMLYEAAMQKSSSEDVSIALIWPRHLRNYP